MNKNVALVLGLLAVVAFVGWQLLGGGGEGPAVPAGLSLEAEEAPVVPDAAPELTRAAGGEDATGAQRAEIDAPQARVAAEVGDVVVLVVDETEQPLAGVEVLVLSDAADEAVKAFGDLTLIDELMERDGRVALSDAEGRLHLTPTAEDTSLLLLGRDAGRWGKLRIREARQTASELAPLVLRPDVTVLAKVVDGAGRPLGGYPVTIEEAYEYWSHPLQSAVSAAGDGVARFAHAQHSLANAYREEEGRLVVQLGVLAPTYIRETFDEEGYDGSPIVLVAPATGSVEVRVFTFEQEPFPGVTYTYLSHIPEGSPRVRSPFSNELRTEREQTAKDGVARYDFVALGMELDAMVTRPGGARLVRAYGPGPARAGETVSMDVRFGVGVPILQLRVLGEGGEPLVEQDVQVLVKNTEGRQPGKQETYPTTDADGFLRIDLKPRASDGLPRALTITERPIGPDAQTATVDLPPGLESGLHEFGDLSLGPPPLFAAGRVVSSTGEALAGARLALEHRAEGDRSWRGRNDVREKSNDDGTFELRGARPSGKFRLAAELEGYASKWVEFSVGSRDVLLELEPESSIRGRLLLDEGIDSEGLRLRVSGGPPGERLAYNQRMVSPDEGGGFAFTGLHGGVSRTVHLQFDDVWRDLRTFADVAAVVGDAGQDPRLNPIDLRGQLFAHAIEVKGVSESISLSGSLVYGAAGADELDFERWFHQRSLVLLSSTPQIDLRANIDGYRQVDLTGVGESVTIELQKAVEVTLVLAGDTPLPGAPVFIKPALAPADDESFDPDVGGDALDERRRVRVNAPTIGRLRVCWIAEQRSESSSSAGEVKLERKQYIDVVDGLEGQSFEVTLTAEEMKKIAERFR